MFKVEHVHKQYISCQSVVESERSFVERHCNVISKCRVVITGRHIPFPVSTRTRIRNVLAKSTLRLDGYF